MESRAVSFTIALNRLTLVLREKHTSLQNTTDVLQMDRDISRLGMEFNSVVSSITMQHSSGGQDWPMLSNPGAAIPRVWKALQREYKDCAASFTAFMALALSTMKRLETEICAEGLTPFSHTATPITKHGQYTSLNLFACNTCYCFSMLWRNYSALFLTEVNGVAVGLTAYMTWMLSTLRQKNYAFSLLQHSDHIVGRSWQKQFLMVLGPSLACLRVLRRLPTRDMIRAVPTLHPGFVSTLCCLTVEILGSDLLHESPPGSSAQLQQSRLRDSGTANFLSALAEVIYHFNIIFDGRVAPPDEMTCPAVMAVAKLSVMASIVIPGVTPEAASTAQGVLHTMLSRCVVGGPDPSTPTHRRLRDSAAAGSGGRYGGADVLPRFEISDTQLLLSVRRYVLKHPLCLESATHLMWWVITVWTYRRGTGGKDGYRLSEEQVGCLLGLLAHCSVHLKGHMIQKRRRQPAGQQLQRTVIQPLQMTQLYNLMLLVMSVFSETMGVVEGGLSPQRSPAQASKGQRLDASPAWTALHEWHCMPGSGFALEAVLRATQNPTWEVTTLSSPLSCAAQNLRMQIDSRRSSPNPATIANLSMAATILKLVSLRTSPTAGLGPSAVSHDSAISLLVALEALLPSPDQVNHAQSSNLTSGKYRDPRKAQLTAIIVMALIRLENWKLRQLYKDRGRSDDGNLWYYLPWAETLRKDAQLVNVAELLVLNKDMPSSWGKEKAEVRLEGWAWQMYAIKNFQGRLLPGCCNLGCTNLAGVSETALPTRLCGGCKRVRYCSVACQRAAWVEAGHGRVCGSGEWAVAKPGPSGVVKL